MTHIKYYLFPSLWLIASISFLYKGWITSDPVTKWVAIAGAIAMFIITLSSFREKYHLRREDKKARMVEELLK